MKKILTALVLLVLLACGGLYYLNGEHDSTVTFRTAPVERGDLLVAISATGTVEPEEVIDVGAQVAGRIVGFGQDANNHVVDYGSPIEEGTVLARIDELLYTAELAQANAQVLAAKASLQRAEAELVQRKAELYQAERDWTRAQQLGPSEALAETSYDGYRAAHEIAKANIAVGEAAILQARASLTQMEAVKERAERNLGYCTIVSPVKGIVIDRRVNIGQTVVASLNAPSLFLIAKDLTRMQVWVAVNEADIGHIHAGQPVTFTVDALPGAEFRGEVGKVRLNASMTQNVVTYTVEVVTDNSDNRLLPYLTANVQFEVSRRKAAMLVPNAALRWKPSESQTAADVRGSGGTSSSAPVTGGEAGARGEPGVVWVVDGAHVRPVPIRTGVSDGVMTEVLAGSLEPGALLVTGVQAVSAEQSGETTNPFGPPRIPRGGRGGPPPPV